MHVRAVDVHNGGVARAHDSLVLEDRELRLELTHGEDRRRRIRDHEAGEMYLSRRRAGRWHVVAALRLPDLVLHIRVDHGEHDGRLVQQGVALVDVP